MRRARDPNESRRFRLGVLGVLAFAAVIRLPPFGVVVPGPDLQETYVRHALVALATESWAPEWPWHGPGFFTILRAIFSGWYALGWLGGWWSDRIDMLASYFASPHPFQIVARGVVVAAGLATVGMVARLGRVTSGSAAGIIGALVLAVLPTHVRESLQTWPDVPATALVVAAVAAAYRGTTPLLAGLLGGAAIACKTSAAPVVLPVVLGLFPANSALVRRTVASGAGGLLAYLALAHTVATDPQLVLRFMRMQTIVSFGVETTDLSLPAVMSIGIGWPIVGLAVIGTGVALRTAGVWRTILLLAFPVAYLATLAGSGRLMARYLVLAAPFVALFAGVGASALGRLAGARAPLAAGAIAVLVCAGPLARSIAYVRCMARPDTRLLAGEWLAAHVPGDSVVVLPSVLTAPNPVIPGVVSPRAGESASTRAVLRTASERLAARGGPRFSFGWLALLGKVGRVQFDEPAYVVAAAHPAVQPELDARRKASAALTRVGAERLVEFPGAPTPLPPGVLFDPIDADYTPLLGAGRLDRPGPTLTVWRVPPAPKRQSRATRGAPARPRPPARPPSSPRP